MVNDPQPQNGNGAAIGSVIMPDGRPSPAGVRHLLSVLEAGDEGGGPPLTSASPGVVLERGRRLIKNS